MDSKKPIDRKRDSAGSMEIGTPDEGSLSGFVNLGDRLLLVKEDAVYEFLFADQIDPDRTNPSIENSQQLIFNVGSNDPILARTLLTASDLLEPKYLPKTVSRDDGMTVAFNAAHDIIAMRDEHNQLSQELEKIKNSLIDRSLKAGFTVPTIEHLDPRCKSFIQRSDHFIVSMLDIARFFLGKRITHADSLLAYAEENFRDDEPFLSHVKAAVPLFRLIRLTRNAIEHPKPNKKAVFVNIQMQPDGSLAPPLFELIDPQNPNPKTNIVRFFGEITEDLSICFEMLVAFLCDRHANRGDLPVSVAELPVERRRSLHVRYSYTLQINGEWVPLS